VNPPDRAAPETAVHDMVSSISPAMTFGPRIKPRKAARAAECDTFEQLPNVGPAMAGDLRAIGLVHPRELAHRDPFVLYQALCAHTGRRQDPCVPAVGRTRLRADRRSPAGRGGTWRCGGGCPTPPQLDHG